MIEGASSPIRKFNPGTFQSDGSVIEQFVVREGELAAVCEVLRGNIESPSCQHILVVAPRGRGKTMLLARVAAEIRTKDEFSRRLLPVRFMEESQEIFNMADFWLETLFHLARECTAEDPDLARELRGTHTALSGRWGEQPLADNACATVLAAADRLDRKLVLMVENLQDLCSDVDEDFAWKLRKVLQTEPQIMLVASATSRFDQLDDTEYPFFEMFRTISLKPLTTKECGRLWQVVSGAEAGRREIRPLEILTGGSPRLLVIVAGFARHGSFRRLMEELVGLIDEHTEYFRGHLDILPKTERRVYVAVLDLWRSSSAREIADRARMDIRAVSTMLKRLVDRGAVLVDWHGKKRVYVAAESLYCIYYRLRREREEAAIVENLLRFMTAFYSETERDKMLSLFVSEIIRYPVVLEGFERAVIEDPTYMDYSIRFVEKNLISRANFFSQILDTLKRRDTQDMTRTIEGMLGEKSDDIPDEDLALALLARASVYRQLANPEAAISDCDRLLERFGSSDNAEVQRRTAFALNLRGIAWQQLGDAASAIASYRDVLERFGENDDPNLQMAVVFALNKIAVVQMELGNLESAISTCGAVIECFDTSDLPDIQILVVLAIVNKGRALVQIGCVAEALAICNQLERRLDTLDHKQKPEAVWSARDLQTRALAKQGDLTAAFSAFRSTCAAFLADNDTMIRDMPQLTSDLIAAGAFAGDLAGILSSDTARADALLPLVVALRQHAGETVRAPPEILEVARDIRESFYSGGTPDDI